MSPGTWSPIRLEIWSASWQTYYKAYYNETRTDMLFDRWLRINFFIQLTTSLTAGGSGIAGWTIWHSNTGRVVWSGFAGLVALIGIVYAAAAGSERLKNLDRERRDCAAIRLELEKFRLNLRINTTTSDQQLIDENNVLLDRYNAAATSMSKDIFATKNFERAAQKSLNQMLGIP